MKVKKTSKKNSFKENCYAYSVVGVKELTVRDMVGMLQKNIGIPEIRSSTVIYAVCDLITQQLMDGSKIVIDNLGSLRASVSEKNGKPEVKIIFRPTGYLLKAMEDVEIEEV